ncbi:MAG TPA: class I SAM-dependent methyltransferase [Nitrospiraceae bacterium]|nr:class I SAM-dependent methyltransferase [Nitrospiraceae bacterium]
MLQDAEALPQLIGDYKPVDQWQVRINTLFYRFRGDQIRSFYQTYASADYRLAHALAADYFEKVMKRDKTSGVRRQALGEKASNSPLTPHPSPLTVLELGPGNGNLAASFLSHLKVIDKDGVVYPRIRYVLVDWEQAVLDAALAHPELAPHRNRVETHRGTVDRLDTVADGSVDRIICNELWNDLPTKLLSRQASDIEEEFLRPNMSETLHAKISDWAAFVRAFDALDIEALKGFPPFLDDVVWEREYRAVDWKDVPYRKTITEFLKRIDEHVLVPVNLGAYATMKEAKRLLAPKAIGFSSFDSGTADMRVLNDPEKPCYGQFGGQQSFMVNFALVEAVAKQLEVGTMTLETQREFVGRSLGTNVLTLMDLIATHPSAGTKMAPWEQDRLMLKTFRALNETYRSPYARHLDFPIPLEMPPEERESLQVLVRSLTPTGIPDTVAYLTEEELTLASKDLEDIGYDPQSFMIALSAPPSPVDYVHSFIQPR